MINPKTKGDEMRNKLKKLPLLLSLLAILFFAAGSSVKSIAASPGPDFSGKWDFFFYDASGKLQGKRTITVSEDGSISGKAILNLDNVIYNTEVSAAISANGRVTDGTLTDTDKLEMVGTMTGSFSKTEGSGKWKNYYKQSGTWKATRSSTQEK